jgi:DEAD/DEAH box helicase domain-containing protein
LSTEKSGHGLQAVEWFKTGEFEKIEEYCKSDVKITRDLYEFGVKNKQLFYNELASQKLRPFPVNFALPIKNTATPQHNINLTLPF